eukprot:TRINITY_DN7964_c0_g1_i1.p1 TRINITY_DN7964_c0_g1~~TRINITY_DN7964_c0_g1_i1.p1  ORF type:complete len:333 (-),score=86.23 TRINITY_DN7964_c0_g1_i1:318-1316(-)
MSLEKRVKPKSRPGSAISYESPSQQRQMQVLPPEANIEYEYEEDIVDESLQELENAINEYSMQRELGLDSPFITALKPEDSNDTNNHNENKINGMNNSEQSSANTSENNNPTAQEDNLVSSETEDLRELLFRISNVQDQRRKELSSYLTDLKDGAGKGSSPPLVQFPQNFEEIVETSDPEQSSKPVFWSKFLETDLYPVDKEKKELTDKIQKGLERIQKLDQILASKTKEARAIKASMMNNQGGGGNLKKSVEVKEMKQEDFSLRPEEEARVEEILKEEDSDSGFSLSKEQIQKLEEINKRLETYAPNLDNLIHTTPTSQIDTFSKKNPSKK